jgi:type II restriction enzyme
MSVNNYRRKSYEWMREIIWKLHRKTTQLNSRYWDQLFDKEILPPELITELANFNSSTQGLVEVYIYALVHEKYRAFSELRTTLEQLPLDTFSLDTFLGFFEKNAKYRGSIDKAYEIAVYALFNAIVEELQATVTLSVDKIAKPILHEFEDFTRLVLGVDSEHCSIVKPARLFRVGTANANDAGLDMWANFGPAVQVKHLSLSPQDAVEICNAVRADQVIVVCKIGEEESIQYLFEQLGIAEKLRGIITKSDLKRWYSKCFQPQYRKTLGHKTILSIVEEMKLEFPLAIAESFELFYNERQYSNDILRGEWAVK